MRFGSAVRVAFAMATLISSTVVSLVMSMEAGRFLSGCLGAEVLQC